MITKFSNYHSNLAESPLPAMCALSGWNFMISALLMMQLNQCQNFLMTSIELTFTGLYWWSIMSVEMKSTGKFSSLIEEALKFSMLLFISSEIWFFFTFFWSYFHYYFCPSFEFGWIWPPIEMKMLESMGAPLFNTVVLLSSAVVLTIAHSLSSLGPSMKIGYLTLSTSVLGVIFLSSQFKEYKSSFFSMNDSNFGSIFFILTGFHGVHVLVGFIFLSTISWSILSGKMSKSVIFSFELSAWYWHFVDVVWLYLFYCLYYLTF